MNTHTILQRSLERISRTTVQSPDPLRQSLNHGFLIVTPVLFLSTLAALIWYVIVGATPYVFGLFGLLGITLLSIWPTTQRGSTWGIMLVVIILCFINALSLGARTLVTNAPLIHVGYILPIFIAALFLRPRAALGALILQLCLLLMPLIFARHAFTTNTLFWLIIGAASLCTQTTLIILACTFVHRSFHRHLASEHALRQANNELEQRITERTTQLSDVLNTRKEETRAIIHDLGNQFYQVQATAEFLMDRVKAAGLHIPEADEDMASLNRILRRQEYLLKDMMSVELLNAKKITMRPREMYVGSILFEFVDELRRTHANHDKPCTITVRDTAEDIAVWCDTHYMGRVYYNILDNAEKYSSTERGIIITITIKATETHVVTTIEDRGLGIRPDDLAKIGQEFQRLNNPDVDGSGVGLNLCYRLVHMNLGYLRIDSRFGYGTTLAIAIPRADTKRTTSVTHA